MPGRRPASIASGVVEGVTLDRMSRDEFFAKAAPVDEERLRKALWNLYWRGTAAMRKRIEAELTPDTGLPRQKAPEPPDPTRVRKEAEDFVALARSGAYIAGSRRVSPKERSRWRFTFKRLLAEARDTIRATDLDPGIAAMTTLIDLACEMRDREYFRSDDPIEAAKVVVSDEVSLLWNRVREHRGFAAFAALAAPQLICWESPHGWSRSGWGPISQKETTLASVVAAMLPAQDAWATFTDYYLAALDELTPLPPHAARKKEPWFHDHSEWNRKERARNLVEWHGRLLDRFADDEDGRLDRLTNHPALAGPELTFLQAQLAYRRGTPDRAHKLMEDCLAELPGHQGFRAFASEIGAAAPDLYGSRT